MFRIVMYVHLIFVISSSVSDPESTTAYDVTLTDCTAIEPVFNALYDGVTPRALVISAYKTLM